MEATRSGNEGVLESPRPSSSFSALGVPARLDGAGPVGAQALGLPNWFEDTGDDMLQRVKDREELFEKMITGPGITAMKFPRRRGKPRTVLLTLVSPGGGARKRGRSLGGGGGGGAAGFGAAVGGGGAGDCGLADLSQSQRLRHQRQQQQQQQQKMSMGHMMSPFGRSDPSPFFGWSSASASALVGRSGREMDARSSPKVASSSFTHVQPRSFNTLLDLELVWSRQRGGKGSLRVREVVDALAGPQSQVLKPVCEELRRRAVLQGGLRGGGGGGAGDEEDTFVSLLTRTRTLDLKFATVVTRDCFLSAFKTFAWEKGGSAAPVRDAPPQAVQRHYPRRDGIGEAGGGASANKLSRDFDRRPYK